MHIAWFEYSQFFCLLVAIYFYPAIKKRGLGGFLPFLILVNVAEFLAQNKQWFGLTDNYIFFNIYLVVATPFYFFVAGKMLFLTGKERMVFYLVCFLSLLLVLLNFLFMQGLFAFNTYSIVLIESMTIVFSSLSLVRLTVLESRELNFAQEPYFWINAVNLMSGLIILVVLGLMDYIRNNHVEIASKTLYSFLMPLVAFIQYLGYSYAFILCRTQKTR